MEKEQSFSNLPEHVSPEIEERKRQIEKLKVLNRNFIEGMLRSIQTHIQGGGPDLSEWQKYEEEWKGERELIERILKISEETDIIIDPQYWTIPMGFAKRLGIQRLECILELINRFVLDSQARKYVKEINVQAEESYLSLGCAGFFDGSKGKAEIPQYLTFDKENFDNFYATFIHEAVGHPGEMLIQELPENQRKELERCYNIIRKHRAFFGGNFGRVYPHEEMRSSFGQFIAEFTKQYCLEGDSLREYISSLRPSQREAYETIYKFFKATVFRGREFSQKELEFLIQVSRQFKIQNKKKG